MNRYGNSKILVAATDYPDLNGKVTLMYIHVRNVFYKKNGLNVIVLNFRAKNDYEIDGIKVITLKTYNKNKDEYKDGILVCHAANLRNHFVFLTKNREFKKIIFFYHGHEVLKINKTYSKPYKFAKPSIVRTFIQNRYDELKLFVWKKFIIQNIKKLFFVFVSKWMLEEFLKSTKVPFDLIRDKYMITYNCIGEPFENNTFKYNNNKRYDFLTIRSNLDGSKYAIDIVNSIAYRNPSFKFLLYGKGEFFSHYDIAPNIIWMNETLNHQQITSVMQKCRCALMPTRTDSQGLMMCELASTGMPLITSDLPVCHEVFDGFANVAFIQNKQTDINLNKILVNLENNAPYEKNEKYFNKNTSKKELELLESIIEL